MFEEDEVRPEIAGIEAAWRGLRAEIQGAIERWKTLMTDVWFPMLEQNFPDNAIARKQERLDATNPIERYGLQTMREVELHYEIQDILNFTHQNTREEREPKDKKKRRTF